jgi:hypothetical protein
MISISSISQLIGLLESHGKVATAGPPGSPTHTVLSSQHSTPQVSEDSTGINFPVLQGTCENNTSPFFQWEFQDPKMEVR